MKKIPELLAPGGSFESLKTAISAGADAVYISGKTFGARQYAENFSLKEMTDAINYSHSRGVKVYVTVNTLIREDEIPKLGKYLFQLYQIGADALLVQDWGVIKLAREIVPHMDLHASTQMTTHNTENIKWMEENGFKRTVLSRELSLDEIKSMVNFSPLDLEVFVHGALCYSYSGQCLLSSFIGGRSGNRGMCAQPCRKPYSLVSGPKDDYNKPKTLKEIHLNEDYLLSTRDLGHYPNLESLVNSGIKSLKIEGRMRSPEYVGVVVSIYRKALDKIDEGIWKPSTTDLEKLHLVFNRGFSSGHLLPEKSKGMMGRKKPGHLGMYIGDVKRYHDKHKKATISLKSVTVPHKGDGLFFEPIGNYENKKYGVGFDLEQKPYLEGSDLTIHAKKAVVKDSRAYITRRKNLKKTVSNTSGKFYNLKITFKVLNNRFPELKGELIIDNDKKIMTTVQGKYAMEKAIKRPLSGKDLENQIIKVGDKPFKVKFINSNYLENLFLPLKEINLLRRNLIEKIEKKISASYMPSADSLKESRNKYCQFKENYQNFKRFKSLNDSDKTDDLTKNNIKNISLAAYVNNLESLKGALKSNYNRLYLEIPLLEEKEIYEACFNKRTPKYKAGKVVDILTQASDLCKVNKVDLIWKWPDITRNHLLDFLKYSLKISDLKIKIMVSNPGIAQYLLNNDIHDVYGSSALNIWNRESISHLSSNFGLLTLSPELSLNDIKSIQEYFKYGKSKTPNLKSPEKIAQLEVMVQGNLESLISQECLLSRDLLSISQKKFFKEDNKFFGIKDAKNHVFPLKISPDGQTIIQNSAEVCLVDYLPSLISNKIYNFAIDARGKGPLYAEKMGSNYMKAINLSLTRANPQFGKLKTQIKKISLGGITAGNFLRGVDKY
ncbi:MAG: U32 family peptidase [Methanobacteriaceae archaeon]|nr:U32 family peptidase [Methanobacteriaceae archaeon]